MTIRTSQAQTQRRRVAPFPGRTMPRTMPQAPQTDLPQGCGPELTKTQEKPVVGYVEITYFCTACGASEKVAVRWRSHHAMPKGWRCRDIIPTHELPRRTDHIFSCPSKACREALDRRYPPPAVPKWFASS